MDDNLLDINDAYISLKEGLVLLDKVNAYFKLINDRVYIKSENVSYNLEIKEFLELYKNSKFVIFDDNCEIIDSKKDEEYYSFKHK